MASRAFDQRAATALPLNLIAQAIPMLTRHELAALTERLVDALDMLSPDSDFEPDDEDTGIDDAPCDEPYQDLEPHEDAVPIYGIDQRHFLLGPDRTPLFR